MSEESIQLQPFCSKDHVYRGYLTQPFNFGRYTYATDGRVLVRVPVIPGYDRASKGKHLQTARGARGLLDARKFPKRGFIQVELPRKKDVPKNSYNQHVVQIGASNFNMVFLLAMKRLPNLKVIPPAERDGVMPFTFDGGIGKVMPTFAQARFTINHNRKETQHAPPKEKADRDAGKKRAAIHRRRKRRAS